LIYIVEDDDSIRKLVLYSLTGAGFEAEGFPRPSEFWDAVKKRVPDLVLLDIMLPEEDGLEILKKLRKNPSTKDIQIIMLTAKSSEYDKVIGLDEGADDYVAKPFSMMELTSRVRAAMRRVKAKPDKSFTLGTLVVNDDKHTIKSDGQNITLTLKEYELLLTFIKNPGIVFTRDMLLNMIWGYDFDGASRTVDVHVRTLRSKLGKNGDLIETVRGIGYRIGDEKND